MLDDWEYPLYLETTLHNGTSNFTFAPQAYTNIHGGITGYAAWNPSYYQYGDVKNYYNNSIVATMINFIDGVVEVNREQAKSG